MGYVRVEWPWSQEWMSEEYEDEVEYGDDCSVFVPEELYNRVNSKQQTV